MLTHLLSLFLGAYLGSVITRQYDKFKERENEAHKLLLALNDVVDFSSELAFWDDYYLWRNIKVSPRKEIDNAHILSFLDTKLAAMLPSEVRMDFKQISEWIYYFNNETPKNDYSLLGSSRVEKILSLTKIYSKSLEESFVRIINSFLFTNSWRFKTLGLKPNDKEISVHRTPEEIHDIRIRWDI
ncbi:MAG: hypothetical protein LHV69_04980 [Elusimicrobia bacterium]|nr:hypothetical protein [Candidatus Obscuribacterium magneticum]MCB4756377.1 hypothetical protein [Candidatus Obscuribacterium magneticum]